MLVPAAILLHCLCSYFHTPAAAAVLRYTEIAGAAATAGAVATGAAAAAGAVAADFIEGPLPKFVELALENTPELSALKDRIAGVLAESASGRIDARYAVWWFWPEQPNAAERAALRILIALQVCELLKDSGLPSTIGQLSLKAGAITDVAMSNLFSRLKYTWAGHGGAYAGYILVLIVGWFCRDVKTDLEAAGIRAAGDHGLSFGNRAEAQNSGGSEEWFGTIYVRQLDPEIELSWGTQWLNWIFKIDTTMNTIYTMMRHSGRKNARYTTAQDYVDGEAFLGHLGPLVAGTACELQEMPSSSAMAEHVRETARTMLKRLGAFLGKKKEQGQIIESFDLRALLDVVGDVGVALAASIMFEMELPAMMAATAAEIKANSLAGIYSPAFAEHLARVEAVEVHRARTGGRGPHEFAAYDIPAVAAERQAKRQAEQQRREAKEAAKEAEQQRWAERQVRQALQAEAAQRDGENVLAFVKRIWSAYQSCPATPRYLPRYLLPLVSRTIFYGLCKPLFAQVVQELAISKKTLLGVPFAGACSTGGSTLEVITMSMAEFVKLAEEMEREVGALKASIAEEAWEWQKEEWKAEQDQFLKMRQAARNRKISAEISAEIFFRNFFRKKKPRTAAAQVVGVQEAEEGPTSQYRGVSWNKARRQWQVQMSARKVGKLTINLGYFDYEDEEDAARIYDRAQIAYLGQNEVEFTNFPLAEYSQELDWLEGLGGVLEFKALLKAADKERTPEAVLQEAALTFVPHAAGHYIHVPKRKRSGGRKRSRNPLPDGWTHAAGDAEPQKS